MESIQVLAPLITSVVGAATSVVGAMRRAEASEVEADTITAQYREMERADRKRSAQILAKQQAGGAAAGLDISSGTPLALALDTAYEAERNALNIRRTGQLRRTSKLYEGDYYRSQAGGAAIKGFGDVAGWAGKPENQSWLKSWFS